VKYAWIGTHKSLRPVTVSAEVLGVRVSAATSNIDDTKLEPRPGKPDANKRISNEALLVHILVIHAEVKHEYSWPKMCKELVARGIRVGKERVRKMMKLHGIKAKGKKVC
jgi:putative transposase